MELDELIAEVRDLKANADEMSDGVDLTHLDDEMVAWGRAEAFGEVLEMLGKLPDYDDRIAELEEWALEKDAECRALEDELSALEQSYDDDCRHLDRHALRRCTRPATVDALERLLDEIDPQDAEVIIGAVNGATA